MIRRVLGLGAAVCLLVGTTAGGARAAMTSSIWQVVPSANPQPHLVTNSEFAGVSMGSATDGWAVGLFMAANAVGRPLVEHWDGTAWTRVPSPAPSGRQAGLAGVDELSTGNAWAVGDSGQNFHIPYVEHWNGTAWSLVKTPNRGGEGSLLNGITALGPGDVWAVGQTQQLNGAIMPMTDQFNGTSWSVVPSPVPGSSGRIPDDSLDGAASLSGGLVFAVGARDIPGQCCLRTLGLKTSAG
ncbi:MAG TPA: hypothetical protein VFJ07_16815 [Streptosporangiaceae bacterium]|nr:hypothetical protein [Streptosporangiaceae bacterium]